MLEFKEYLPIGSIVLLRNAAKKIMIIGILQENGETESFDYIGVMYPEGYMTAETLLLFNHRDINDVIQRGYENPERQDFIRILEENKDKF